MSSDSTNETAAEGGPLPAITAETMTLAPPDEDTPDVGEAQVAASATPPATDADGPRTRWAGIVWGLFFAAAALGGLWVVTDSSRRGSIVVWASALTPGAIVAYSLLALGVLILVAGLVGLLRRGQRRLTLRRSAS